MADDDEEAPPPITWKKLKEKKVLADDEEEEEEDEDEELPEGDRDEDGIPIGQGIMSYPSGDKFEGTLISGGKREGKGKYTFGSGASFQGDYKNNTKNGSGVFVYPDKSSYEGTWKDDQRTGEGVYKYANGDVYKGSWDGDLKTGQGSYFFKDSKSTFMGDWKNGKFASGEWILKDGTIFKGKFKNNKPWKGTFIFAKTGNVVSGAFDKSGFFIQDVGDDGKPVGLTSERFDRIERKGE
mmetsp:Transcript_468/g.655  ORF Transcript_468/g.655 Transcript_468/m.655 type:complete len:239 (-) Transcript_468:102-818(-)|eukprot:CAMPEP_0196591922 /NCGR_PEP_ID=MMETSP1081-20130531/71304_1 /TAXON_ID=36882 /ORGANISM="Pyramimonas amylifera, Strain CCMP720" /LENGTH=238 /DNA_ID=CAMNT_0041915455 /DNA_START=35 /DNA_END=751 /DNA_ORIENTATION=+